MSKKRILILINQKISDSDKNWMFFHDKVQTAISKFADVEIYMGEMANLSFELLAGTLRVFDRSDDWSLGEFDMVVFRSLRKDLATAGICALFLKQHGIPYIDDRVKPVSHSKFAAQAIRQAHGIESVPSYYAKNPILRDAIENTHLPFSYPIIIKDNNGRKGQLNFIARTKEEAVKIIDDNFEVDFIVQKFIPNDGDYRVIVMGGVPKLAILRQAQGSSHLNNTSQGATSTIAPLEGFASSVLSDVSKAAELENLQVAGVDLMFDKNSGQHHIMEVNSSPQLATGAVSDVKVKIYAEYLASLIKN